MDDVVKLALTEEGADAERLDQVTGFLRQELRELDVEDVTPLPAGEAPEGTRGIDVAAIGGLLVTLGQSTQAVQTILMTVRAWLGRGGAAHRSVRVEIGGDVLELTDASTEDQDKLVDLFLRKHG
ncbi:MAG: hypothetical protein ABIQ18_04935 [Umezawaea sp.]